MQQHILHFNAVSTKIAQGKVLIEHNKDSKFPLHSQSFNYIEDLTLNEIETYANSVLKLQMADNYIIQEKPSNNIVITGKRK
jgi:hypothetical protein